MNTYIGTKIVKANPMTRLEYNKLRGWELPASEDGNDEGYLVEFDDGEKPNHPDFTGYISWLPKHVFELFYAKHDALTFGHALEALKSGFRVTRKGWNGKDMYLWLMPANIVPIEWIKEDGLKDIAEKNGGAVQCLASIRMKTADGSVLTGWLASQTDMLSNDWYIVG